MRRWRGGSTCGCPPRRLAAGRKRSAPIKSTGPTRGRARNKVASSAIDNNRGRNGPYGSRFDAEARAFLVRKGGADLGPALGFLDVALELFHREDVQVGDCRCAGRRCGGLRFLRLRGLSSATVSGATFGGYRQAIFNRSKAVNRRPTLIRFSTSCAGIPQSIYHSAIHAPTHPELIPHGGASAISWSLRCRSRYWLR